jgi:hypothetical protein
VRSRRLGVRRQAAATNEEVLTTWKEIATYLHKGVRTVQRWERDFGLPVRRPAGARTNRGPILALTSDIDAWVSLHCRRLQFPQRGKDFAAVPDSFEARLHHAMALRTTNQMLLLELRAGIAALHQRLEQLAALRKDSASLLLQPTYIQETEQ